MARRARLEGNFKIDIQDENNSILRYCTNGPFFDAMKVAAGISECLFFRSMQSMADVVLLRISVGSFPSLQLGAKSPTFALHVLSNV